MIEATEATDPLEAAQARLEKKKAARAAARAAQEAKDIDAEAELMDEHSPLAVVKVAAYVPGHPTRALARMPNAAEWKRYRAIVGKSAQKEDLGTVLEAQAQLGRACWVYPREEEGRKAMTAAMPGIETTIGRAAVALAEGKAAEEGKG